MKNIIFSVSILIAIVLGTYLIISGVTQIKTSLPTNYKSDKSSIYKNLTPETIPLPNFISPDSVKNGYVQNPNQDPADDCRPRGSALYPIKQPYVDYNKLKGGDYCKRTCDVIKFNSPP